MGCSASSEHVHVHVDADVSAVAAPVQALKPVSFREARGLPHDDKQIETVWQRRGGWALEPLLEHTVLIDARFLVALAAAEGVIPRCQDVPDDAKITPGRLRLLQTWSHAGTLPVLVLSYPWLDRDHPDKHGEQLRRVAPILEAMLVTAGGGTVGVMWDFMSLPQKPRAPAAELAFRRGLSSMHAWYARPRGGTCGGTC